MSATFAAQDGKSGVIEKPFPDCCAPGAKCIQAWSRHRLSRSGVARG